MEGGVQAAAPAAGAAGARQQCRERQTASHGRGTEARITPQEATVKLFLHCTIKV